MAGLGEALLSVGADVSGFEDDLADALNNALGKNKFAAVLVPSAAVGVAAVIKEFVPLEKAILQIFQVEGVNATEALFNTLSNQILDVAIAVGKPAEEVGQAIALGIGRGFTEQESIDLSEISSNLSVALGEDLSASAKGVTAAINGFNLSVEDADRVAGVLFQTIAKSGVPMSQLAQQIGNIAPAARNAGVSLEDAAAAVTTMVQQGISAAEATTQIRTAITELSRAGSDGGKVFQSISGTTFPEFIKQGHTLGEALALIQSAADKSGFSVQDLTGNYNTANATVGVAVNGLQNYTDNLELNKKGVEDLSDALDSANQGVFRQFQIALNNVRAGVERLGVAFRPLIQGVVSELTPVFAGIGDKINKFARFIDTVDFTPLVNGIGWLVDQFMVVGPLIESVFNLFAGLNWQQIGDAIKLALVPVVATIVAIRVSIEAVTKVIEFLTPAVQVLLDIFSFLAVPLGIIAGLFAAQIIALGALAIAFGVLGKAIKIFRGILLVTRLAVMALWTAFGPVGAIVVAIGLVTAAFIYAWQESEKFRTIVVGVINTVKDAVVTGVEWMIRSFFLLPRAFLTAANEILKALAHLPKWLGGGVADTAQAAVQSLLNGLDAIEGGIHDIANAARNADIELSRMISRSEQAIQSAAQAGLWFGNADTDKALREALRGGGGGAPRIPTPNTSGLNDLLNPKKTEKAAKDTAKRLKDTIGDLFKDVQKFAKDIGEKSVSAIESGYDSLVDKFQNAIEAAAEAGNKTVVKRLKNGLAALKKYEKQLVKLANKRDLVQENLKLAQQTLTDLKTEAQRFGKATMDAFVNLGSVAEASHGIGVTFRGISNNLKDAIRTTQLFDQAMRQLQALGLNEASLRQLADAGPAALDQARALARAGAGGIKEINDLQAQLEALAGKNATNLTNEFFAAGISAANGLVKGLKKQEAAIIAQMEHIADVMVASIKKKLKIKSPSQIFADEIGAQIPAGAAVGVRRGIPELVKAIEQMSAASTASANFGAGSVQVNGVSDPAAARRAGILAGTAIAETLAKRATAQTLAGVR